MDRVVRRPLVLAVHDPCSVLVGGVELWYELGKALVHVPPREVLLGDCVELGTDSLELLAKVERRHGYLVPAHPVGDVRLHLVVGPRVEQHAGDSVRLVSEVRVPVLHVSEDLVQVVRVHRACAHVELGVMRVVLAVDDQHVATPREGDVAFHGGQQVAYPVVECPLYIGRADLQVRPLAPVVLQDELLVEPAHLLVVFEVHEAGPAFALSLEQAVAGEPAGAHEHAVASARPIEAHAPVNVREVLLAHVAEVREEASQPALALRCGVRAQEQQHGRLEDAVHWRVRRELGPGANRLTAQ